MNRLWIYGLLLIGAMVIPSERCDLGTLHPVETVSLYIEDEVIVIETDTGALGKGGTMEDAFADMKETTAGIIYLDTADYLLVRGEAEKLIPQLRKFLKGSVRICRTRESIKVDEVAAYLQIHVPEVKLSGWRSDMKLPELRYLDNRMYLEK